VASIYINAEGKSECIFEQIVKSTRIWIVAIRVRYFSVHTNVTDTLLKPIRPKPEKRMINKWYRADIENIKLDLQDYEREFLDTTRFTIKRYLDIA
jgi:hypothetical protein